MQPPSDPPADPATLTPQERWDLPAWQPLRRFLTRKAAEAMQGQQTAS